MTHRLHFYSVYLKPGYRAEHDAPLLVSEGFNWFSFLLGPIWALYHRLWDFMAIQLLGNAICWWLEQGGHISELTSTLLMVGIATWAGFEAANYQHRGFKRRGYVLADVVAAEGRGRAAQRYLDRTLV